LGVEDGIKVIISGGVVQPDLKSRGARSRRTPRAARSSVGKTMALETCEASCFPIYPLGRHEPDRGGYTREHGIMRLSRRAPQRPEPVRILAEPLSRSRFVVYRKAGRDLHCSRKPKR